MTLTPSSFNALVLLSGGVDSLLCLHYAQKKYRQVGVIHFSYGQHTQAKEKECAQEIAQTLHIPQERRFFYSLPFLKTLGKNNLTSADQESNYVPMRNTIFLAIAAGVAEANHAQALYIGAVLDDENDFPDCRPRYFKNYQTLLDDAAEKLKITIETPVITHSKKQILGECLQHQLPLEKTWSCYTNPQKPCGVCQSCRLLQEARESLSL